MLFDEVDQGIFDEGVLDSGKTDALADPYSRRGPWTPREVLNLEMAEGAKS